MEKSDAHTDQRKTNIENYFLTFQPSPPSLNTFIYIVSFLMIFGVALMLIFQSKTLTVPVVAFLSIIL